GRFRLAFNGEIYNFRELRSALEKSGHRFVGHSDTEVLLGAFEEWGICQAIARCVGMFAIAVWDRSERRLTLARDRFGEKPLYYGLIGSTLVFGSEIKSLRGHPCWQCEVDRGALALLLRHNYIPAPYSIYRDILKLAPGTTMSVTRAQLQGQDLPSPVAYWSAKDMAENGLAGQFHGGDADAVDRLDAMLRDTISLQMVADVPLGAFLSGGVDSSTVVSIMQALAKQPVRTFTIGFAEAGFDEAGHAKAVASHLGTDHTELYVTPADARDVIPRLPFLYDEPFADSSQIPTFLVAQLARRHVTVCLSGDAGDEMFGGYVRHVWAKKLWNRIAWAPAGVRKTLASVLHAVPPTRWDRLLGGVSGFLPANLRLAHGGDKIHKLARVLAEESPEALYRGLISHVDDPAAMVPGADEPPTVLTDITQWASLPDITDRIMFLDSVSYLPDDILVKVDRASMGVSLETRVPFLDHRIGEFAWSLPLRMKIRDGVGKWILRRVLNRYVPDDLVSRPKAGFAIPIDAWLRGPLKGWAEALLDEGRLQKEAFFDPRPVRKLWDEHASGRRNCQGPLWSVLMFQAWLESQGA
ncbi:MAG: asparagine synthase (glutamine-hydrolyzing), partial [Candidatus Sericytochromatia bacterium]|nr:asparagine synthase (glutamine-hydrolyzing) [Candidatus Tanganyikabacteria bacterium]